MLQAAKISATLRTLRDCLYLSNEQRVSNLTQPLSCGRACSLKWLKDQGCGWAALVSCSQVDKERTVPRITQT